MLLWCSLASLFRLTYVLHCIYRIAITSSNANMHLDLVYGQAGVCHCHLSATRSKYSADVCDLRQSCCDMHCQPGMLRV